MYENFGFVFETFYDEKFKFLREISSDPGGNLGISSDPGGNPGISSDPAGNPGISSEPETRDSGTRAQGDLRVAGLRVSRFPGFRRLTRDSQISRFFS